MNNINDGGSAFPHWVPGGLDLPAYPASSGMSLRDWFAGQIAASMVLNASELDPSDSETRKQRHHRVAMVIYEIADALIDARCEREDQ